VPDVETDPSMSPYLPVFRGEKIGSLAFIPLVAGGRLVGKFMVYYDRPRGFSPSKVDMAIAIANHVAAACARFATVAQLEQTVRFNEMFAGILGHDLRNPLGAIMASAELAQRRDEGGKLARPLSRILSSGHRMARMIDQLLDFTRVRVGAGIPLQARPGDLFAVLRQVTDELEPAHPGLLHLQLAGRGEATFDADRMSQVFSNLVGNAIQHGRPEPGVTIRADGAGADQLRIEVKNPGMIPAALLGTLFEPMSGGERRRDGSQGLGLGLYISRQIVEAHGGQIEVRSNEEAGTTFAVLLPRMTGRP
jgi:signal transduction histidine kinase